MQRTKGFKYRTRSLEPDRSRTGAAELELSNMTEPTKWVFALKEGDGKNKQLPGRQR